MSLIYRRVEAIDYSSQITSQADNTTTILATIEKDKSSEFEEIDIHTLNQTI